MRNLPKGGGEGVVIESGYTENKESADRTTGGYTDRTTEGYTDRTTGGYTENKESTDRTTGG